MRGGVARCNMHEDAGADATHRRLSGTCLVCPIMQLVAHGAANQSPCLCCGLKHVQLLQCQCSRAAQLRGSKSMHHRSVTLLRESQSVK